MRLEYEETRSGSGVLVDDDVATGAEQIPRLNRGLKEVRIGVVGCGYWGAKHVRVLSGLDGVAAITAIELNPRNRDVVVAAFPGVRPCTDLDEALPDLDAVIIATPPQTHTALTLKALRAGKHVLVEKPLAPTLAEASDLVAEAARVDRTLMVGHTFEFNPAVRELRQRLDSGELGRVFYVDSARLNLGLYRTDVNVVWDLAPHDVSILNYLLRSTPTAVSAWGASHASATVEDLAYIRLDYAAAGVTGYVRISWLDPKKVRRVTVVGSKKMAVYNDLDEERLRIFDRGVELGDTGEAPYERPLTYRYGDIISPHIRFDEPLAIEDQHFIDCIRNDTVPQSDGRSGLAVVAVLDAIDRSLRAGATVAVTIPNEPRDLNEMRRAAANGSSHR